MATGRKMETLGDLQRFKEAMLANVADLTAYEGSRLKFEGLVNRAVGINQDQAALTAAKQEASRLLDEVMREAQRLATVLRFAIKDHYGPDSEKLIEFGIQPFRGLNRKPKTPTPEAPAPVTTEPAE
ncbi:MAG TPA: hypothetical protein VFR31_03320 [Thermoanaerobaculia bacterium]|nr:hypothetical protein [Thermoanaerobaculia bacterium]